MTDISITNEDLDGPCSICGKPLSVEGKWQGIRLRGQWNDITGNFDKELLHAECDNKIEPE